MVVGVSVCELHLPGVRSLKGKRKIVKSLVERLFKRYRVSIAETDFHDLHQRTEISIAAVGQREQDIEKLLEDLREILEIEPEAFVTRWTPELLTMGSPDQAFPDWDSGDDLEQP